MAGETTLHIIGTVVADPELRFTQSGAAVVNVTIASNERRYDKEQQKWVDGDALFMRCNAWRQFAENIAESFVKGDRVIGIGRLKQRQYETREGEKRSVIELELDALGADTRFRTVTVNRADRSRADTSTPPEDPWASRPAPSPQAWGGGFDSEPPF
jgi:single-strand DNA-binding protein